MLEDVGGLAYLGIPVTATCADAANIGAYADIVRERAVLRRLIEIVARSRPVRTTRRVVHRDAAHRRRRAARKFELAERGQRRAGVAAEEHTSRNHRDRIRYPSYHAEGELTGIPTGFEKLDQT